ncbi:hypothetical protein C1N32_04390 [Vibrio diazotrophicus]|uniref:Uncharacterized protein n=1 Tax=Vibrio diazotrophicus TaxID=685 RepID=A0A2J8I6Y9_VIBDI|nr:hypothetical protein [Vibrio diazotrophicus]PNI06244.1 hypothetical protein C1N32_04390 [Vibrio diazotrophicus]
MYRGKRKNVQDRIDKVEEILKDFKSAQIEFGSLRRLSDFIAQRLSSQGDKCTGSTFRRKGVYRELLLRFMGQDDLVNKEETKNHLVRLQSESLFRGMSMLELTQKCTELEAQNTHLNILLDKSRTDKRALSAPPKAEIYSSSRLKILESELDRTRGVLLRAMESAGGFRISFSEGLVQDTSGIEELTIMDKNDFPYFFSKKEEDREF